MHDRGSTTIFTVIFAATLILCVGLVVDGGIKLRAARAANNCAQEAARAGAQQADLRRLRTGNPRRLDPVEATAAAQKYLSDAGATCGGGGAAVTVSDDTVSVSGVTITRPTVILGAIGIGSVTVVGNARARLVIGTDRPV